MRDRLGVIARRGVEPAEAKLGCRRSTPIADERLEQSTALVERSSFEGRFGEADPGGQIRLLQADGLFELPGSVVE